MAGFRHMIKGLSRRQLTSALRLFIRHPLKSMLTLWATKRCLVLCQRRFGDAHHGNTPANAYRHALWNMLLLRNVLYLKKNKEEACNWAWVITNMHEELAPNSAPERKMDLWNNKTGRDLYLIKFGNKPVGEQEMEKALLPLLRHTQPLENPSVSPNTPTLVYLEK